MGAEGWGWDVHRVFAAGGTPTVDIEGYFSIAPVGGGEGGGGDLSIFHSILIDLFLFVYTLCS